MLEILNQNLLARQINVKMRVYDAKKKMTAVCIQLTLIHYKEGHELKIRMGTLTNIEGSL